MPELPVITPPFGLPLLRQVVNSLDGDLYVGDTTSQGRKFWIRAIEDVIDVLQNVGLDAFVADARGHAPDYGCGTPLDLLTTSEMMQLAAQIDATEFAGRVELFSDATSILQDALRSTLLAIYEDVFSAVGAALEAEELGWDGTTLAVAR